MKTARSRFGAVLAILIAAMAGYLAFSLFKDVQFARAQQEVKATREQLATVQDLGAVFREVGRAVEPSVVHITVKKTMRGGLPPLPFDDDTLRRFFRDRDGDGEPDLPEMPAVGTGSGVIMDVENGYGYVVTNNHVAGGATEMTITLFDGREVTNCKVVGTDPKSDLAVVRIESDRLIPAEWGNSDELQKGDFILAFGSPFGYVGSMTHGIVSALNRDVGILRAQQGYENFIQVDAPINPGNSGGPLVNLKGQVVGINTAIASRNGGFQGIGFSIPSNQAKHIYEQLKTKGKVTRGWLGVEIANVSALKEEAHAMGYEGTHGVLVKSTMAGTPASGKLRPGDIIVAIDGDEIRDVQQLRNRIAQTPPGKEITLSIVREKKKQDVKITIGEQPEDLSVAGRIESDSDKPDSSSAAKLGVKLTDVTPELSEEYGLQGITSGALVTEVQRNSVAARVGIEVGEVITQINDSPVKNARDAVDAIGKADLSKGARIFLKNKGSDRMVFIKTGE
jgi:serine protease Do